METVGILRFVFGSLSSAQLKVRLAAVRSRAQSLTERNTNERVVCRRNEKRGGSVCVLDKGLTWGESEMKEQESDS